MDLAVEWRARRWQKLLDLVDMLPRDTLFSEALANDDELADAYVVDERDRPAATRRVSEFGPVVELLSVIADRQAETINAVIAAAGAKPGKVSPMPRPVTAVDRAKRRQQRATHEALVARVLPKD